MLSCSLCECACVDSNIQTEIILMQQGSQRKTCTKLPKISKVKPSPLWGDYKIENQGEKQLGSCQKSKSQNGISEIGSEIGTTDQDVISSISRIKNRKGVQSTKGQTFLQGNLILKKELQQLKKQELLLTAAKSQAIKKHQHQCDILKLKSQKLRESSQKRKEELKQLHLLMKIRVLR